MADPAKFLVVYLSEAESWGEVPLFEAIVRKLCSLGIQGSTAHSGRMGFGRSRRVRLHGTIGRDENRPVLVTAADSEKKLRDAIPHLRALAPHNTILLLDAEVVPSASPSPSPSRLIARALVTK